MSNIEQIKGSIKTVTYFNEENGYFVVKVLVGNSKKEVTVTGNTPSIHVGESITAKGSWAKNDKWGPQFKSTEVSLSHPSSSDGVEKYLVSSVAGVGKGFAKKLVDLFGADLFDVIEKSPEKLSNISGIGKKRVEALIQSYTEQQSTREIMVFLFKWGLSASRAKKIFDKYGHNAVNTIKKNPYVLCRDFWGIGFSTADGVALAQGVPMKDPNRIRAGLLHILGDYTSKGSCGAPLPSLREKCAEILEVPLEDIDLAIRSEISAKGAIQDNVDGTPCLFLPSTYLNEINIAERLLFLSKRTPVKQISDIDAAILKAELSLKIELDPTQRDAVRVALASSVCVITGGPGTGKSTITKVILNVFKNNGLSSITLCAPTGKAAKRATEASGFQAQTVHRVLGVDGNGKFKKNRSSPIEADVYLLDEASMTDVAISSAYLDAISVTTRLIIVGDVDQLPSVGPGKVLADIISSNALPTVKLTKIFRQAATSDIIKFAHAINRGEMIYPSTNPNSDFKYIKMEPSDPSSDDSKKINRLEMQKKVVSVVKHCGRLGYDPVRDVQVLAPMRKGPLGIDSFNSILQAVLNPNPAKSIEWYGIKWGIGDKVMQIVNNYDKNVYNGDVGYIQDIDLTAKKLTIEFDEELVLYEFSEIDEICLAYAFSIHKSQGSEFPVAVLAVDTSHYMMLKRNLLYTGVTRAKKLCCLISNESAIRTCVSSNQNDGRHTKLKDWLVNGVPELKLIND